MVVDPQGSREFESPTLNGKARSASALSGPFCVVGKKEIVSWVKQNEKPVSEPRAKI
jgi:hypothetical protein